MSERQPGRAGALNAGSWDPAVLEPLAEINDRVLEVLSTPPGPNQPPVSALCALLAAQWHGLDAARRARLAACPYLLLDCRFASAELWAAPLHAGVRDAAVAHRSFAGALGAATLRHVLLIAWHWSRANPLTAQVALGLSGACAQRIAESRLRDLEALAEQCPAWIRPRWEERPEVWRQLLAAPSHPAMLQQLHLRGLQLLAAAGPGG